MKHFTLFRAVAVTVLICLSYLSSANSIADTDTTYYEIWDIDTLENIGGHTTTVIGNPQVVSTDMGRAVEFDGNGDMLLIDANPLGSTTEYTVEIIFKPAASFPNNVDPRFVHIQDLNDPQAKRVMMEIRINSRNQWYLDGFMNTDIANLTLIDTGRVHPTEQWMHAATTYKDNVFKTYVNGVEELSGNVAYSAALVAPTAKTSLGARMNQQNWYKGLIKTFKVTQKALSPDEFMKINPTSVVQYSDDRLNVLLFPSIADDYINLSTSLNNSNLKMNIYNSMGQLVYADFFSCKGGNNFRISTSNLASGIYYVVLNSKEINKSLPIVIEH